MATRSVLVELLCFAAVVVAGAALVAYALERRRRSLPEAYEEPRGEGRKCGCVFDIDGTLTCGDPSRVVAWCKTKGCAIGVNTARPAPHTSDVPLREYGFPPNVLNHDDVYYNPHRTEIAAWKVKGLREFQAKWKISSPEKVLFFDDNVANVDAAASAGFSTVVCSAGVGGCGIGAQQETKAARLLEKVG